MDIKIQIKLEVLEEMIESIDQLILLYSTGGQAFMTGHSYNPEEYKREIDLLKTQKESLLKYIENIKSNES